MAHQVVGREILRDRQRRYRLRRRFAFQVVDVGEHLDGSDTVGDGVAEMHHDRGAAAFESLDQRRGPQRPGDVEGRLRRDVGEVQHLAQGSRLGDPDPADVEVQVEIGIDHPPRCHRRQRRRDDLLPQSAAPCETRCRTCAGTASQSGSVSRISSVMIPERVRGLASPRCRIWSNALSSSGSPSASRSGTSLMARRSPPAPAVRWSPR